MQGKTIAQQCYEACNKLVKWRAIFAGWQLGTRPIGDPECDAVRDHREVTILLRAEQSALVKVLVDKHIFTEDEYQQALLDEARQLDKDYEHAFPGMKSTDIGMQFDARAGETMKNWRP
jgi:hypothetical protein